MNNGKPVDRIAAALRRKGIRIGDGKNVKDAPHLADLIEVACLNYRANASARRFARLSLPAPRPTAPARAAGDRRG